jgi:GT2 family glycosyltransferase
MSADWLRVPKVSIIVPTFNRRDRLERLLRALPAAASHSMAEVIVVVDGDVDGTTEMLATLRLPLALRVLTQANRGPAAARNLAMSAATGDVLLFLDDDVIPSAGLVDRHLHVHRGDPAAVVIGPMVAPCDVRLAPWLQWEAITLKKQYDAMVAGAYAPTPRQFYTANGSLRREHALAAGGFDESFTRAEDIEFAHRLEDHGLRFYFVPEASVLHESDRSFESWLRVPYEYGRYAVRMSLEQNRPYLRLAYQESDQRHVLSRLLARWCVASRWTRPTIALCGRMIRRDSGPVVRRIQYGLCSLLFHIQYWQGIADCTGLGHRVWDSAHRQAACAGHPTRPAAPSGAGNGCVPAGGGQVSVASDTN